MRRPRLSLLLFLILFGGLACGSPAGEARGGKRKKPKPPATATPAASPTARATAPAGSPSPVAPTATPSASPRASAPAASETPATGAIRWETDLDAARRKAEAKGADLFVVFYGPRCENCKHLRADADAGRLAAVRRQFVWVWTPLSEHRERAMQWGINGSAVPVGVIAEPGQLRCMAPLKGYPLGETAAGQYLDVIAKRYADRALLLLSRDRPDLAYRDYYFIGTFDDAELAGKAHQAIAEKLRAVPARWARVEPKRAELEAAVNRAVAEEAPAASPTAAPSAAAESATE